ncbi:MAG: SRPBCC family protein [Mycobacteriaceae bacterium]
MTADEAVDAGPETRIVVRRTVPAPAAEVFALLSDPARHHEIDGSGMVRAAQDSTPVTAVGDVFTMHMHREARAEPDYATDNHVLRFKPDRRIAWATCLPGAQPSGFYWEFELQSEDELTTEVVHTYDWSAVTDPAVLARTTFPLVSAEQMQATLDRLAAALS